MKKMWGKKCHLSLCVHPLIFAAVGALTALGAVGVYTVMEKNWPKIRKKVKKAGCMCVDACEDVCEDVKTKICGEGKKEEAPEE